MALNNFKCNHLLPLHFKWLSLYCLSPILQMRSFKTKVSLMLRGLVQWCKMFYRYYTVRPALYS